MKSSVVQVTEDYYDSSDADNFYFHVWGGEDIHIGLYETAEESIAVASRRTVERMAGKLEDRPAGTRVLDLGAGYGGAARFLAAEKGYRVTCLNLSAAQNKRNRSLNEAAGLADLIDVVDGNFENLPFDADSFDVAWSQDSFLHSGDRNRVFEEIDRVLVPGGEIVFTDPMQKPGVDRELLRPVLDRIHLESMGSVADYRQFAEDLGWTLVEMDLFNDQLGRHYARVRGELESRKEELGEKCSSDYIARMKAGLSHWVEASEAGRLEWGILRFLKSESSS